jgi:hypothetical protein
MHDPMGDAAHRHQRALHEGDPLRHARQTSGDPGSMGIRKADCRIKLTVLGNGQDDVAGCGRDPQGHAPGRRTAAQVDPERLVAVPDLEMRRIGSGAAE